MSSARTTPLPRRSVLLNPGPATTSDGVKSALLHTDICPREREFGDLMARVSRQLVQVVRPDGQLDGDDPDYVAVLLGGAGTAGVEAAIASALPADGRLLVIDNGAYGARMAQIAAAYGIAHDVEQCAWGDEPQLGRIERRLDATNYSHLAVVHHETTTGMLNPVDAIGELCRSRGVQLIVDAMSSFAGIPIDIRAMGADYLISSANKCIQGVAGVCFVICRRETLDSLEVPVGRSLYLDLAAQQRFFEAHHQMRFTPPVQVLYGLEQALTEFFAETQQGRWQRYRACFDALDGGMRELGFRRLLPERLLSRILTAYVEPDHPAYSYDELHDRLRYRGFTIYPGKGAKEATFRLANMGAIEVNDMHAFVEAMSETIHAMGVNPLYSDAAV